jgi:hypothetical protein
LNSQNVSLIPNIRHSTNILLELALLGKMIQRGIERSTNKVSTWDDDCSVNLTSQGHCAGVFIGA